MVLHFGLSTVMGGEGMRRVREPHGGTQVGESCSIGPRDYWSEWGGRHEGKELEAKSDLILGYPSHGYLHHLAMAGERDQ